MITVNAGRATNKRSGVYMLFNSLTDECQSDY